MSKETTQNLNLTQHKLNTRTTDMNTLKKLQIPIDEAINECDFKKALKTINTIMRQLYGKEKYKYKAYKAMCFYELNRKEECIQELYDLSA